ncbi:hypothetical protein A9CBEGH2_23910 [Amedibacterium intestinale]|uniref:Uncharacterized protein n=1 Tax=Amedibacterium intestinale TaxID=2583452 RepID=A0A6N4TMY2_9FIRM|nr:hypothetical protein Aargi30884_26580 [Amedibacterium intestinale]BBK63451.1 hypothetical protein A9CBEGH2_23910 [Amedibacterium intestinale]
MSKFENKLETIITVLNYRVMTFYICDIFSKMRKSVYECLFEWYNIADT